MTTRGERAGRLALLVLAMFGPWLSATAQAQVGTSGTATPAPPTWLAGCWTGGTGGERFSERWSAPDGRTLLGLGYTVKGGRVSAFDYFRVITRDGRLIYVAQPGGQPPTEFTAPTATTSTEIVFENLAHDYPKRVGYQRVDATHLTAWIDGGAAGSKRVTFAMHAEPCEPQ